MSSQTFTAAIPTTGFCSEASQGMVASAWAATGDDVWATCEYPQSANRPGYLYGTVDGGRTWRPVMGSPKP